MKYALVIVVIVVGLWLWQRNRSAAGKSNANAPVDTSKIKSAATQQMISCSVCGVHLPKGEASVGKRGMYCSKEHQHQVGD